MPFLVPFLLAAFLLAVIVMPRFGALAVLKRWRTARARERLEDALKFLVDAKFTGSSTTPEAIRAALHISPGHLDSVLEDLTGRGLARKRGPAVRLTVLGERWALQVLRAHRLWERFLADEARMPLDQIHAEAHHREHRSSPSQVDELDAALGYPAHDPHGDPIPTRRGSLRRSALKPITSWRNSGPVRIEHLEDEPAMALQQILAAGLRPGQVVRIMERSPRRIVLSDGTREFSLAPSVAANIHVARMAGGRREATGAKRLSEVAKGTPAEILRLDDSVQGFTRRRFLDLGLTPGTMVVPELSTFFGDPRGYRVRGTLIALRNGQAEGIWVRSPVHPARDEGPASGTRQKAEK